MSNPYADYYDARQRAYLVDGSKGIRMGDHLVIPSPEAGDLRFACVACGAKHSLPTDFRDVECGQE